MSDLARERGVALLREGRFAEAAAELKEAVAQNGGDEESWRFLGAALGSAGDATGAVQAFGRTVALSPTSAKNRYNLALAQERAGEVATARTSLEQALTLDPGYAQAREMLARLGGTPSVAPTPPAPVAPPPGPAPLGLGTLGSLGGAGSAPPAPPAAPWASAAPAAPFERPAASVQREREFQPPGRTFLSVVLAFVAGLVGTALWVAFVYFTNFNLALIGIGVGFLIGLGASMGYGRDGKTPAIIAIVMAVIFIGGFSALNVLGSFLIGKSGLRSSWSVVFNVLCTFWGIQQAYKTASSPVDSDD